MEGKLEEERPDHCSRPGRNMLADGMDERHGVGRTDRTHLTGSVWGWGQTREL